MRRLRSFEPFASTLHPSPRSSRSWCRPRVPFELEVSPDRVSRLCESFIRFEESNFSNSFLTSEGARRSIHQRLRRFPLWSDRSIGSTTRRKRYVLMDSIVCTLRPMAVQKTILIVLSRRLHGTCDTVLQNAWPDFDRRGQCDCFSSACQGTSPSYCVETSPSTVQSR